MRGCFPQGRREAQLLPADLLGGTHEEAPKELLQMGLPAVLTSPENHRNPAQPPEKMKAQLRAQQASSQSTSSAPCVLSTVTAAPISALPDSAHQQYELRRLTSKSKSKTLSE